MATKDPRVDAYIERAQPFAKPILKQLRKTVHAACPDVVETIKWGVPAFEYKGPMCGMAAFKAYCTFGFWKSALLENLPDAENPMSAFGRLTSVDDLPPEKTFVRLVKEAARLNDDGIKLPREVKSPKPPVKVPAFFSAALKKNRKAQSAFEAFSPSHRREYVEWITDAKTDETRNRRMAQAVEWISEGKGRNWKYQP
jgi:uncharacterized protein YdeI (YjbR/CyaY-like superfamily)